MASWLRTQARQESRAERSAAAVLPLRNVKTSRAVIDGPSVRRVCCAFDLHHEVVRGAYFLAPWHRLLGWVQRLGWHG
jgi:hypothetical protein